MKTTRFATACAVMILMTCGMERAQEKTERAINLPDDNAMATLKPGAGVEAATGNCAICHSTDYIVRQPGSDAKHWEAEVRKMVTVYGAQINDEDVKVIVDYLVSAYGPLTKPVTSPLSSRPVRPRRAIHQNPK